MTSTQFLQLLKREDIKYRVVDRYVDVDGNCELFGLNLTEIPIQFRHVSGSFSCHSNQLTSLKGAPYSVGGYFYCHRNLLTSLSGAPSSVGSDFYCAGNPVAFTEEDIQRAMQQRRQQGTVECVIDKLVRQ